MDRQLKAENVKLHRKIVKLEVLNRSQLNRISALEKEIKKLAPTLGSRDRLDGLKALRESPALLTAAKKLIAKAEKTIAETKQLKT
jgi:hypothetical protein